MALQEVVPNDPNRDQWEVHTSIGYGSVLVAARQNSLEEIVEVLNELHRANPDRYKSCWIEKIPQDTKIIVKSAWRFLWRSNTQYAGGIGRRRVSYLLKAARSRGATIERLPNGYLITDSKLELHTV